MKNILPMLDSPSKPNTALAVSTTRQTTTVAISMGLPILSLTLRRSPLSVRARTEIFEPWAFFFLPKEKFMPPSEISAMPLSDEFEVPRPRLKNGLAQRRPSSRTVPL